LSKNPTGKACPDALPPPHRHPVGKRLIAFALLAFVSLITGAPREACAQFTFASDAQNNYGSWSGNGGSGFGDWTLNSGAPSGNFSGHYITNSANNGVSGFTNGAFMLYAKFNNDGVFARADRNLSTGMQIGDTFSFQFGVNWDADNANGGKGFNLYVGGTNGTEVINFNMGGNVNLSLNGTNVLTEFGTSAMTINVRRTSSTALEIWAPNGRDGGAGFTNTLTGLASSEINAFSFYISRQNDGDNRNLAFNNLLLTNSGVYSNTQTESRALTGGGKLVVSNNSTLTLTSDGNTFTGGTDIKANSTLSIGSGGGTGDIGGNITNAGTVTFNRTGSLTYNGVISSGGAVTKSGSGTITLGGASSYTGTTTINAGALRLNNDTGLGATNGAVIVNTGGALELTGGRNVSSGQALVINSDGVSSGGALRNISGNNTWGGTVTLSNANTRVSSDSGTLTLGGAVNINNNTLYLGGAGNITIGGAIQNGGKTTDNGALFWDGVGTLRIDATPTALDGNISLRSGTVLLGAATALGGGAITIGQNAAVTLASADGTARSIGNAITLSTNNLTLGQTSGGTGALSLGGIFNLGSTTRTLTVNAASTISGAVTNTSGNLTKAGSAQLTLSSDSSSFGTLTIDAGNVAINGNTTVTGLGSSGGSMSIATNKTLTANIGSADNTFGLAISGGGSLTKAGAGTLRLTSTSSDYTGATRILGGLLAIDGDRSLGAVPGSATTGSIVLSNATLGFNNSFTLEANRGMTLTHASGATLNVFDTRTVTYNGIIAQSGTAALTKAGGGTLILGGNNTFSGNTTIGNGVIRAADSGAFGTAGTVSVSSGAALHLSNNVTLARNLTLAGAGINSGGALRSVSGSNAYTGLITATTTTNYVGAATNATLVISNINSGAQEFWIVGDGTTIVAGGATNSGSGTAFVKTNAGTAVLMSSNAWSGNEFIRQGTVIISNNNALGVGGTTFLGDDAGAVTATLTLGSGVINSNALTVVGGGSGVRTLDYQTASGTGEQKGNIALNGNLAFNVLTSGTMLFSGTVTPTNSGTVRLALDGGGTLISTGNSTGATSTSYQVRIGNGTLIIGAGTIVARTNTLGVGHALDLGVDLNNAAVNAVSALRASNNITISNSIFVSTTNSQARIIGASGANAAATFSGPIGLADAAIWLDSTNGQTVLVSGPITNASGTGSLIKTNDGLAILTGANTYSGTTTISGGTLQVGNGGSTGQLGSGNVTNNGALVFNRTGILAMANLISGNGSLTKLGAGTLTLSNANTFSGGTILSEGAIRIGNNDAFGTGSVTVNAGTLASSIATARTITNSIILGGNITLGEATSGIGALTFSGPVSLGSDTRTITVANPTNNTISGIISGTGGLTIQGAGTLTLSGANTYSGNTTVSAGTLLLGANNVIDNASAVVINGGTLSAVNRTNTVASLTMSSGALSLSTGSLTLSGASSITGGDVSLTSTSTITTVGLLTLGNTTINSSYSAAGTNNAIILGGGITVNASTTANITNTGTTVRMNLGNAVRTFEVGSAGHLSIDWNIYSTTPSSGGLTKTGDGTLTLNRASTFTGGTTLSAGVLRLGDNDALGGLVTLNGGTIASTTNAARAFANQLAIGGNVTFGQAAGGTGALTFSSTATNNLGGSRTLTTLVDTKIDGAIGNGSIVKEGGTALILSNASNNFSGLTINTGTVRFQTNALVNTLAGSSGTLDLAGGTVTVSNTTDTSTLSSTVSGAGNLTKAGASTLVVSGNNTGYSGTTTLTAGTLRAGSDTALGTGTLALNGGIFASGSSAARGLNNAVNIGGNVQFGDATGTGNLTLSNTVNLGGGTRTLTVLNDTLMRGVVSNGGITKEGAGTLQLSNAATSFGALTINAGQLAIRTNAAVTQLAGSGGTLDLAGASTLTVTSTGVSNAIASAITGSGNLIKAGDGTLVLSGNNTYSGTTTISNGVVRMNSSGTAIGGNVVIAGGTLNYQATVNDQIATGATMTMTSGAYDVGSRNQDLASMTMSGGTLSRAGGTLTLGGPSSFTGGTVNVSATGSQIATTGETTFGAVTFSNTNTAGVTITNALVLGGNVVTTGSGTSVFASTNGSPFIVLGDTRTFNIASGTAMEVGWGLRGGSLTKTGDGRLDLLASAGGSMTNVTLSTGVLRVGANDALGAASLLALNSGTFASANADARTITNALTIGGNVTLGQSSGGTGALTFSNANLGGQARTLTVDQAVNFVGAVTNGSLTKAGSATLAFSNAGTSLANLNITAGSVAFQTNATVGGLAGSGGGALSLAGGTLTIAASTNSSFAQVISGTGGLAKTGSGTLTLSGDNTYSGATTVSEGRFAITGTNTSSAILVTNTGSLSGTGRVGNVVVAGGGLIAPGSSPGNLTVADFTMAGGGGYQWEITNVSGTAGIDWDLITITGETFITATSDNKFTIFITGSSVAGWSPTANTNWLIMDWSGGTGPVSFTNNAFALNSTGFLDSAPGIFSLTNTATGLMLYYTGDAGSPTYDEGSGVWSTGFSPSIVNNADAIFDGAGGAATNDITNATFDTIGTITFATNATGSYTLEAASGAAGFDTNSALVVAGNIVNESAYAQTIDMALSVSSVKTANAASNDIILDGDIIGSGGINKIGDNMLVLNGANSYAGATTISNGTVRLGSATALGATNAGTTVSSGAVLDLYGQAVGNEAISIAGTGISGGGALINSSASAASLGGALTLTANATINNTGDLTLSSAVGGAFTLTKDGAGVLNVGASNTVTGMTINAGTVNFGFNNALGTGTLTINGGTLAITNTNTATRTLTNNVVVGGDFGIGQSGAGVVALSGNIDLTEETRAVTVNRASTFSGVISNGGLNVLASSVTPVLTLSGANTFSGPLNINGGTVAISGDGSLNTSVAVDVSRTNANSRFDISGINASSLTIGSLAAGNDAGATVNLGDKTLIAGGNNGNTTFGGVMSNTGSFVKTGTGTMTFTRASTYTGATTISNGEIALTGSGALSASTALNLAGATSRFDISGITGAAGTTRTVGSLAGASGSIINLGNKNLSVGSDNSSTAFAGILTNTGSLTKTGTGTMTLSGANTFSGGSTLSAGVLRAANSSALGTGALVASEGTTLEITNGVTIANNMSVYSIKFLDDGNTLTGTITNNNATYDVASGTTNTVSGFITGDGGLTLIGGGTLNVTGTTNDYAGATVISNGTLQISTLANAGTVSSIGTNGTIELDGATTSAAVIDYTGGSVSTDRTFALGGGTNGGGTLRIDDAATVVTATGSVTGEGTFVVDGPGTLVLSNTTANQFNPDAIQVNSGATLALGASEQLGNGTGLILNGGTFLVGGDTFRYSETLGTLTLSASSTIDFGAWSGGTNTLSFTDSSAITWTGTLTITNWQGVAMTTNDVTQILFGTGGLTSTQLSQIYFASQDIDGGALIGGELVPVPEPRVYAAAVALLAVVGWRERKRLRDLLGKVKFRRS
jgi:fibronectin-binding autotransporter adhesin